MSLFDDHLLVILHIPKCAGTTLDRCAKSIFQRDGRHYFRAGRMPGEDIMGLSETQIASIRWLSGHFPFGSQVTAAVPKNPLYISTIRDPLDRIRSFYAYQYAKFETDPNPTRTRIRNMTLDAFGELLIRKDHFLSLNDQCRILGVPESIGEARPILSDRFLLLTTSEGVGHACDLIKRRFGDDSEPSPAAAHLNPSDSGSHRFSPDLERRLRERTAADLDLFEWVRRRESDWLQEAESTIAALQSQPG